MRPNGLRRIIRLRPPREPMQPSHSDYAQVMCVTAVRLKNIRSRLVGRHAAATHIDFVALCNLKVEEPHSSGFLPAPTSCYLRQSQSLVSSVSNLCLRLHLHHPYSISLNQKFIDFCFAFPTMPSSSSKSAKRGQSRATTKCTCGKGCKEGGCLRGGPRSISGHETAYKTTDKTDTTGYTDPRYSGYSPASESSKGQSSYSGGSSYSNEDTQYQSSNSGRGYYQDDRTQDKTTYYSGSNYNYSSEPSRDQSNYQSSQYNQGSYAGESAQNQDDYYESGSSAHYQEGYYQNSNYK